MMAVNGSITFAGDLYAPAAFHSQLPLVSPWVCNLEGPITNAHAGTTGKINLRVEHLNLEESIGSLPAAVSLANNHVLDYGDAGMRDTLRLLESSGIQAFGLRTAAGSGGAPAHIRCSGLDVAILGYVCPSTHPATGAEYSPLLMDDRLITDDIRQARREGADRVVLFLHWGQEEVPLPTSRDRLRAQEYAEAGADLIIGHHSHCIQRWELVGDCPVFYGLGNFFFPDPIRVPTEFDRSGSPSHWFERKLHSWNQTSLLVEWFPASLRWRLRTAVFHNDMLTSGGIDPRRWRLTTSLGTTYSRAYEKSARASSLKVACADFFARPRIPTRERLALAANMILGRNAESEGEQ
jgi:hypothetical protein